MFINQSHEYNSRSGPFKLLPLGRGDVIGVVIFLCSALPTGEKAKGALDHGQGPLCTSPGESLC